MRSARTKKGDSNKMNKKEAQAVKGFFGDETVFYTNKGRCFHVPNCPSVRKSSGNVTQMKRAIEWGLMPCCICEPEENFLYKEKYMRLR